MLAVDAAPRRAAKPLLGRASPRIAPPLPARSEWKEFRDLAAKTGITLYPWQETAARYLTARAPDGRWLYPEVAIIVGRQNGKALALDTPIPTPAGWTPMGDLAVGDTVFDEQGSPCTVTFATDVMHGRDCYRVDFSDGTTITADAEHQWYVEPRFGYGPKARGMVLTTEAMVGRVRVGNRPTKNEHRYRVPVAGPLQSPGVELPIAPYTLGAWLGDGHSASARLTTADQAVLDQIAADGYRLSERVTVDTGSTTRGIGVTDWQPGSLQTILRRQTLLQNKHVPSVYLRASTSQRLALLQGLMDTDGYVSPRGQCEFTTIRLSLAEGVMELIRSLGMKPRMMERRATLSGRDIGPKWRLLFYPPVGLSVFRLPRKLARQQTNQPTRRPVSASRYITGITPVPSVPVRCIQVDSPSHLYLAGDGMVPTHNTTLLLPLIVSRLLAGKRIMHTAQNRSLPRDFFEESLAPLMEEKYSDKLRPRRGISYGAGMEKVTLRNGGVYRIVAPTRGGARGPANDLVIVDELREMESTEFIGAAEPTLSASSDPQMVYLSNMGTETSIVLNGLQERADKDRALAYLEWSAAPDRAADDIKGWLEGNPASGHMPGKLEYLHRKYNSYRLEGNLALWETEHLCRKVPSMRSVVVDPATWATCRGKLEKPVRPAMAISMDASGTRAALAMAWKQTDGTVALRVVADVTGSPIDSDALGREWSEIARRHGATVGFNPWTDANLARHFRPTQVIDGRDYANGSVGFALLADGHMLRWDEAAQVTDDLTWSARKDHDSGAWMAVKAKEDRPIPALFAAIRAVSIVNGPRERAPRVY